MNICVATKNAGKLDELQAIWADAGYVLRTDPCYDDVVEGDESYEANARLKAQALYRQLYRCNRPAAVLADDSGLEVDALAGRPGVLSARFGGSSITWQQRRAFLLAKLDGVPLPQRHARFVCTMLLIDLDGTRHVGRGEVSGHIVMREEGSGGFGYDPIFCADGTTATFAQLSAAQKNAISHRRRATQAVIAAMQAR